MTRNPRRLTRVRSLLLVGLVLLAVLAAAVPSAPAVAAASWTIQSTPAPQQPNTRLTAISCPTLSDCEAAGSYVDASGIQRPLAQLWNGTAWSSQAVPEPPGATVMLLRGISCVSPAACMAVGSYSVDHGILVAGPRPVADWWNGSQWKLEPVGVTKQPAQLTSVSCAGLSMCVAVGNCYYCGSNPDDAFGVRWNGASWAAQNLPDPASDSVTLLNAVSCPTTTFCFAGGGTATFGHPLPTTPFVEQYNGSSWSVHDVPVASGTQSGAISGLSCSGMAACTAVGAYGTSPYEMGLPLAERWNGSHWKLQTAPAMPAKVTSDGGVSCASGKACTAVWPEGSTPVIAVWNGTAWSTQSPVSPGGIGYLLTAVSCHIAGSCSAVGFFEPRSAFTVAGIVERHTATGWKLQKNTPAAGGAYTGLTGISCAGANSCEAVGWYYGTAGTQLSYAERWNGTAWHIQRPPNPAGSTYVQLLDVSCQAGSCEAVGWYALGGHQQALIERWNGTIWSIQSFPVPPGATGLQLSGVSCSGPSACTAVGSATVGSSVTVPLIERWDGSSWSLEATGEPPGATATSLSGVSCFGPSACEAVGQATGIGPEPFAESWNGTVWTGQSALNPAADNTAGFDGVSCTASAACTAVGGYVLGSGNPDSLIERWNGSSWVQQTAPNGQIVGALNRVLCVSSSSCTSVGSTVERWNGSSWSIQAPVTPPVEAAFSFGGVACPSSTCVMAGAVLHFTYVPDVTSGVAYGFTEAPLVETYG